MSTSKIGKHDLDSSLVLPVANGGTGSSTASGALTNLGASPSSHTHAGGSINPVCLEFTGSATNGGYIDFHYGNSTDDHTSRIIEDASGRINIVTSNGIKFNGGALPVANGGTGGTDAATARTNLGAMANANPVATGSFSMNRKASTTVAEYSFAEGYNCVASGKESHAEGYQTQATNICAHAEGSNCVASGYAAHAEGAGDAKADYSHAEGIATEATAEAAHAEGSGTNATGESSHAGGEYTTASNFASTAIGKRNKAMTTGAVYNNNVGDAFVIGNGTGNSSLSNAFRVTYAGQTYGLSSFNSSGADYAEFFEWEDGNNESEDRVGYFVTLSGNKIKKATTGDYILGIISGQPCIIGNSDEDWLGRWLHDEFGRLLKEDTETIVTKTTQVEVDVLDENGNPTGEKTIEMQKVETGEVVYGWRYKANPEYDSTKEYIERKDRKEWDYVGMLGVLSVRDDGTCNVNGFCKVADGGIATKADKYIVGETYRVIERVTDNVVKVIFR